ncbi:MAG: hypothetical protein AAF717_22450 [Bacteroidota bacterium]
MDRTFMMNETLQEHKKGTDGIFRWPRGTAHGQERVFQTGGRLYRLGTYREGTQEGLQKRSEGTWHQGLRSLIVVQDAAGIGLVRSQ